MTGLKGFFKFFVSGLLLGYLVFAIDWPQLLAALSRTRPLYYSASTLLALLSSVLVASKYYILIADTEIQHPLPTLVKINFISRFYALFLPSAAGPEAVRWYKITKNKTGRAFFLAATLFERLTFLVIIVLCGGIPLMFSSYPEISLLRNRILPIVVIAAVCIGTLFSAFVFSGFRSIIFDFLFNKIPHRWKKIQVFKSSIKDFTRCKMVPSVIFSLFVISFVWQLFFILRLFLLFQATDTPLPILDVAWMGSIVLFLQILPVSFAGLGIREGAYAFFLSAMQQPPEKGVLIGLLFFSQMLIFSFCGGLIELSGK